MDRAVQEPVSGVIWTRGVLLWSTFHFHWQPVALSSYWATVAPEAPATFQTSHVSVIGTKKTPMWKIGPVSYGNEGPHQWLCSAVCHKFHRLQSLRCSFWTVWGKNPGSPPQLLHVCVCVKLSRACWGESDFIEVTFCEPCWSFLVNIIRLLQQTDRRRESEENNVR